MLALRGGFESALPRAGTHWPPLDGALVRVVHQIASVQATVNLWRRTIGFNGEFHPHIAVAHAAAHGDIGRA